MNNDNLQLALDFLTKEFPGEDWSVWHSHGLDNLVVSMHRKTRRFPVPCVPSAHQIIYDKEPNVATFKDIEVSGGEYSSYLAYDYIFEFIPRKLTIKEKMQMFIEAIVNPSYHDLPEDEWFYRDRWILTSAGRDILSEAATNLIASADRDQKKYLESQMKSV